MFCFMCFQAGDAELPPDVDNAIKEYLCIQAYLVSRILFVCIRIFKIWLLRKKVNVWCIFYTYIAQAFCRIVIILMRALTVFIFVPWAGALSTGKKLPAVTFSEISIICCIPNSLYYQWILINVVSVTVNEARVSNGKTYAEWMFLVWFGFRFGLEKPRFGMGSVRYKHGSAIFCNYHIGELASHYRILCHRSLQ